MSVPNIFANQAGPILLSELDVNFSTAITLGSTQLTLGTTTTTVSGLTLSSPIFTGTATAAVANFSGLVTASLGLTVSGAAFTSRGISDAATGKALSLVHSSGTDNAIVGTIAAANTRDAGTAGSRPLTAGVSDTNVVAGGSKAAINISNSDTTTSNGSQLNLAWYDTSSGANFVSCIIAAIHGARTTNQYPSGSLVFLTAVSNTPPTEAARIQSDDTVTLGGLSTAPALKIVPVASQAVWAVVTAAAAGANPVIGSSSNNLVLGTGAALATNATGGHLCIPTCAGTPTGAPTGAGAGQLPMIFDTTNNFLYIYNGGWKKSTVYA